MVFFIKDTLTEEDRAAWRRMAVRRDKAIRKKRRDSIRTWMEGKLIGILCMAFGGLGMYAVVKGGKAIPYAFISLLFMSCGVFMFLAGPPPVQRTAGLPKKDFPPSGPTDVPVRAVFFEDGSFSFWEASKKIRLGYQAVDSLWEDSGCFYLFFQERPPLVMPKRGLGRQELEGFRRFLERTIGKPIVWAGRHQKNDKEQDTELTI